MERSSLGEDVVLAPLRTVLTFFMQDFLPSCQISGIGWDDTVIIDGARGAAVRWKGFQTVASIKGFSWKRTFAQITIKFIVLLFWASLIGLIVAANNDAQYRAQQEATYGDDDIDPVTLSAYKSAVASSAAVFVVTAVFTLALPFLTRRLYGGKSYGHQAWLFGVEGYMSIKDIERRIWYGYGDRLSWSPYGSPLSTHHAVHVVGQSNTSPGAVHVEGGDPMQNPSVKAYIDESVRNGQRVSHPLRLLLLL